MLGLLLSFFTPGGRQVKHTHTHTHTHTVAVSVSCNLLHILIREIVWQNNIFFANEIIHTSCTMVSIATALVRISVETSAFVVTHA